MNVEIIQEQLNNNRRTVAFDSYDIALRQLYDMICDNLIDIAPEYQRHFKWSAERQSQLIESLFLGIPIPSLFMATNSDATWEVIDGLQRLTTIINFIGSDKIIEKVNPNCRKLTLVGLEKMDSLNGLTFEKLPTSMQLMFKTRPIRVTVLNDRSDFAVRYDLFERLNTGGISLQPQEIRNCIYLGEFNDFIKKCSQNKNFRRIVKTPDNAEKSGSLEELVLRFFAYYEYSEKFVHGVQEFLNAYMQEKTASFKNEKELKSLFQQTFDLLDKSLPDGIVRGTRKNTTPVVLFEAISVGTALALKSHAEISGPALISLLDSQKLKRFTTGATNSKKMLLSRIEMVRDTVSS
jgi:hypothetical protein